MEIDPAPRLFAQSSMFAQLRLLRNNLCLASESLSPPALASAQLPFVHKRETLPLHLSMRSCGQADEVPQQMELESRAALAIRGRTAE